MITSVNHSSILPSRQFETVSPRPTKVPLAEQPPTSTLSEQVAKLREQANKEFEKALIDAKNRGIGQLVDADLNEESAKLKALQTQEQLAIQALGIANSSSQNILRLFQ